MRALLSLALAAAGIVSCLADLPQPAQCPAPAKEPIACADQIQHSQAALCLSQNDPSLTSCCACGADACPASDAACFPDGDCPRAVTDRTHVATTCRRLVPEGFNACACGCARCMAVCDGTGPTVATRVPSGATLPAVTTQLPQPFAASGHLGVYVRVRGAGALALNVQGGPFGGKPDFVKPIVAASATDFADFVVWEPQAWPTWKSAPEAPTGLVLFATEGVTTVEIDCIIPFVTP